jgi:hypothetical protein
MPKTYWCGRCGGSETQRQARYYAHGETLTEIGSMAREIPAGQAMLFIRRDAYERSGISRGGIDERLNLTSDEFNVDGQLIAIGPLPDDTGIRDLIDELEQAGLAYFDDFFELSGNWPDWLRLYVAAK